MARAIRKYKKFLYPPFLVAVLIFVTSSLMPPQIYYFIVNGGHAPEEQYDATDSIKYDSFQLNKLVDKMRNEFEKFLKRKIDELNNTSKEEKYIHPNTKRLISQKTTDMWMETFDKEKKFLSKAMRHLMAKGYSQTDAMKQMESYANNLFMIRKNYINERASLGDSSNEALSKALAIGYLDLVSQRDNLLKKYSD